MNYLGLHKQQTPPIISEGKSLWELSYADLGWHFLGSFCYALGYGFCCLKIRLELIIHLAGQVGLFLEYLHVRIRRGVGVGGEKNHTWDTTCRIFYNLILKYTTLGAGEHTSNPKTRELASGK